MRLIQGGTIVFTLAVSAIVVACPIDRAEAGPITICNRGTATLKYAKAWDSGIPILAAVWNVSGWFTLKPGDCSDVVERDSRQELFLSILDVVGDKVELNYYEVDPSFNTSAFNKDGLVGVQELICVRSEKFNRTEKEFSELKNCPKGYYSQVFNAFIFSPVHRHWTIDFK